jgi:predicted pyridoxine 5'-phosphate oxidase superfamily flavin-nucleotide-binding protein
MNQLPDEKKQFIDIFLAQPHIARMATADKEGHPHVVPVWDVSGSALTLTRARSKTLRKTHSYPLP